MAGGLPALCTGERRVESLLVRGVSCRGGRRRRHSSPAADPGVLRLAHCARPGGLDATSVSADAQNTTTFRAVR